MHQQPQRKHSSEGDKEKSNAYSSQFDDLLGKASKKLSKEEQEKLDNQEEVKRAADEEISKKRQMEREQQQKQKSQDFEDLMSGKTQAESEKNLQTLFKEFYAKTKNDAQKIDVKNYVNSARASVGSLSSKLEERRQKLRMMKERTIDIDKEKQTDQSKDQAEDSKADIEGK